VLKNGQQLPPTDVPGHMVNNRTLVPLRFLLESFGAKVEWDQDALAVKIKSPV